MAISIYFPAGAAMKKSMPTPLSTILPASFLKPGWSVWNSFFSVSIPCKSFLSLRNSLPGPHVGRDAKEQTIFPPVALSDDNADSSVGSRAGSGFLTCQKRAGNCARRDVMMDLPGQLVSDAIMGDNRRTLICMGQRKALRYRVVRMDRRCLA